MERALHDIYTVAAKVKETPTDFSQMSDIQLAQEVQKFNGYNHFSRSAATLLEEVVTRLVGDSERAFSQGFPTAAMPSAPVFPMSYLVQKDLDEAEFSLIIDLNKVIYKNFYTVVRNQLCGQGAENPDLLIQEIKDKYNTRHIISSTEHMWNTHTLNFYKTKTGGWIWQFQLKR